MKTRQTVDPEIARLLDEEVKYSEATAARYTRLEIPKGATWLLRGIPVEVDPVKRVPYLRVARHWVGKPYVCPRHSSVSIGGNLEAPCAMCDVADLYANNAHAKVQRMARMAQGNPQYLTYVLVLEKSTGKKDEFEEVPSPACWTPHEFWMSRTTFQTWFGYYKKDATADNMMSFYDWTLGRNFWATKDERGRIALERDDVSPLLDTRDAASAKKTYSKILSSIRLQSFTLAKKSELEDLAEKFEDEVASMLNKPGSDSDDEPESLPPRRANRPAPAVQEEVEEPAPRRARPAPITDEAEDETPVRPVRRPAPPVEEDAAPRRAGRSTPAPVADEEDNLDYGDNEKPDTSVDDESEPPERKPRRPLANEEPVPAVKPTSKPSSKLDEYAEDDVTDEKEDPVPAGKRPVMDEDDYLPSATSDDEDLPKVSAKGASLQSAISNRVKSLKR